MAPDEDELDASGTDPLGVRSGPRRATFTPPPEPGDDQFDDDALAEALAALVPRPDHRDGPGAASARAGRGASAARAPAAEAPEAPAPAAPVADAPEVPEPAAPEPAAPASWVPSAQAYAPPPPPAREPPAGEAAEAPEPAAPSMDPPFSDGPPSDPPPWASAPAPDPSQAVDLPQGPPQRPVRRSLPDDELIGWVEDAASEPGGTLNVINGLQTELNLRIQEAREFQDWEQTMLADGSPEALAAVEEARPEFTGVLPDLGAALTGAAPADAAADVPVEESRRAIRRAVLAGD